MSTVVAVDVQTYIRNGEFGVVKKLIGPPEIGRLKNLTALNLRLNRLTQLPSQISKLRKLTYLDLENNDITDADLEFLKSLKNLETLHIRQTKVTKQGVAALQKVLPKCYILSDFKHQ